MTGRAGKIRVLVVEDSATERELLEDVIAADPRLVLAGAAASGERALQLLERLRPDVVCMDLRLPGIDGIETTRAIMRQRPTPVVVLASDVPKDGPRYFDALRAGALSVVEKPVGPGRSGFEAVAARVCRQLAAMSEVRLVRQRRAGTLAAGRASGGSLPAPSARPIAAIGIAASTGGPAALIEVLGALGPHPPAPVLVVQHIGSRFSDAFVDWLASMLPCPVRRAVHGERPIAGQLYVAGAERHLRLVRGTLVLDASPPVCGYRPSANVLFDSLAADCGAAAVGVLLTGMGEDGALGLRALRAAGGHTIAEDRSTAAVFGMPGAALRLGAACESLPLPEIAGRILQVAGRAGTAP